MELTLDQKLLDISGIAAITNSRRSPKRSLDIAPPFYPSVNRRNVKPGNFRPFGHATALVSPGNHSIIPLVSILFGSRRPAHIAGLIVAVLIWKSIDRMFWRWTRADVGKEIRESVFSGPPVAYLNSATAVVFKRLAAAVVTSLIEFSPAAIFGTLDAANGLTMLRLALMRRIKATARLHLTGGYDRGIHYFCATAITQTFGQRMATSCVFRNYDNCQPVKLLADNVRRYDANRHACSPFQNGVFRDARRGPTVAASRHFSRFERGLKA